VAVKRIVAAIVIVLVTQACVHRAPSSAPQAEPLTRTVMLNGYPVALHVSPSRPTGDRPLLIYATGDGGWRGKDLDLFRHLVSWGYAVAGFSAPQYVKHLSGDKETTTPARLARDYAAIVDVARDVLKVPHSTRIILVGVSRGAGLSVLAAGQQSIQGLVEGVVVMGLTKEEEHVRWRRRRPSTQLAIYDYLPRLGTLPIAVIQSTKDTYLPADEARVLFGVETDRRQFHTIEASNHSFASARPVLYDTLHASLQWIVNLDPRVD
jgi:pimeloyl-ACP methyl ester carboxylesterase